GCGTGGFNRAAEAAGARAWGVDLDPEAVAIAGARAGRGRIVRAAAESLPFGDGSFDVVYCVSTLEHVADGDQALREMARVLAGLRDRARERLGRGDVRARAVAASVRSGRAHRHPARPPQAPSGRRGELGRPSAAHRPGAPVAGGDVPLAADHRAPARADGL